MLRAGTIMFRVTIVKSMLMIHITREYNIVFYEQFLRRCLISYI